MFWHIYSSTICFKKRTQCNTKDTHTHTPHTHPHSPHTHTPTPPHPWDHFQKLFVENYEKPKLGFSLSHGLFVLYLNIFTFRQEYWITAYIQHPVNVTYWQFPFLFMSNAIDVFIVFVQMVIILPANSVRSFITLRPRWNGQHFADNIFKRTFFNENIWISTKISLKFVSKGPIINIPALAQIMTWCRPGDKPLSEPMSLPTHICVTRPQSVNEVERRACMLDVKHMLVTNINNINYSLVTLISKEKTTV